MGTLEKNTRRIFFLRKYCFIVHIDKSGSLRTSEADVVQNKNKNKNENENENTYKRELSHL
jgi:hypothetical protein